ncbi:NtaA/DmoA family FMN-dependent monooxygenase [Cryptosporangium aurantiacum]|uniref:FMN-dependent oxidoreductase, nitrilotriacetate monooxygenase family n=1 Tax=Cryptosporangium aurantiacum TaxID=134849 RepID=A0A1M7RP59_9ACTN|nr:NtaA/DmoA family FMN-dependent monooxygenase [Cryptosporangium aurantiacum]SHN47940.1 FMN-dependent oxidoreductase, nitrilotriacetate monooxygenase family [Cryptosporangium aurantiacum]
MTDASGKRQIHFSLLSMPTLAHNDYGIWRHPESQKLRFDDPAFWAEIARLCEESKMDALFLADGLGITDSFGGSFDVSLREGMHVPVIDPGLVAASVASVTAHLGLAVTAASTFDPPFSHARRMATLDHLTKGRAGWNVVTGFIKNAEDNYGVPPASSSAERYDTTEEFMDVAYKLWEGSWEDDAVVADRESGVYIDPDKVHRIDHVGEHYRSSGPALWHPSPQRTPVIFQAGMSERGRLFAAKHAEVVFTASGSEPDTYKALIADLRAKAASFGRRREDMKLLSVAAIVTGEDDEAARAKLATYEKWTRPEGYLAHVNALNGFNPLVHDRSETLIDALRTDGFKRDDFSAYIPSPDITVGDYMDIFKAVGNMPGTFVGSPVKVADQLEEYLAEYDLDGFLLRSFLYPNSLRDFRDYIVPELQRRGVYRTEYEGTTLRENVFGVGQKRISERHHASSFRLAPISA